MSLANPFSGHAKIYLASRPTYPDALLAYLAALAPGRGLAWDCATGNGQAALALAPHFDAVVATDASPEQLAWARRDPKVSYLLAHAEQIPLHDASVDLVTVASALHWLDHDRFFPEVKRVLRPGGVVAAWAYKLQTVSPEVDAVIDRLDAEVLAPFWLPQVRWVVEEYRTIPFPFAEVPAPSFRMQHRWNLDQFAECIATWSASLLYREQTGHHPIDAVRAELTAAWGDPTHEREVVWPLHLRVGRVGNDRR